jgi:predicted acyl esterase
MTTRWHDEDVLQVLDGERVVLEAFWNGGEWIAFAKREDGEVDHEAGQVYIAVDPERETHMRHVRDENAMMDEGPRQVANAVLKSMRRTFRDDEELRDLVRIRSLGLARRYVRTGTLKKGGE